jgi:coenzyme F420-reducing hydrogenase delta subunit
MSDAGTSAVQRTGPTAVPDGWQPQIVALVCNWCTYAGADMAGTTRLEYPATVRMVRFPCTGRMSPLMILRAFEQGADGVLVSGCHPGDCHYGTGNYHARRKLAVGRRLLETVGVHPDRMHFTWVSAAEGRRFAGVCAAFTDRLRELAGAEKTLARKGLAS